MADPIHIVVHNGSFIKESGADPDSLDFSPVIYLHSGYNAAPAYIHEVHELMADRRNETSQTAARLIQIAANDIGGNLSLRVYNAADDLFSEPGRLTEFFGIASVILYDCNSGECVCINCDDLKDQLPTVL